MAQKLEKKTALKHQIITAAQTYSRELAGRIFLYVFGNEYFEVIFKVDRFLHLTGVNSTLSAAKFYSLAKTKKLDNGQFEFSKQHPMAIAKKKLICLNSLPLITNSLVCVVKDLQTVTYNYKLGVTNLSFTLCLTENLDLRGRKIDDKLLPRSLRIKDKAIENSSFAEFVDFIFVKNSSQTYYSQLLYEAPNKKIPTIIFSLLDKNITRE